MELDEPYIIERSTRYHKPAPARTHDDCPERTKFLEELEARKNREPFTWREILGEPRSSDPTELFQRQQRRHSRVK